jgi:hypothetical protein
MLIQADRGLMGLGLRIWLKRLPLTITAKAEIPSKTKEVSSFLLRIFLPSI